MTKVVPLPGYATFLASLKERILSARTTAVRAVNRELVLLYWDIGRSIADKQQQAGWGDGVVSRLAGDLRTAFPELRGFSAANLWRMQQLYSVHTANDFLAQAARELGPAPKGTAPADFLAQAVRDLVAAVPWGHHVHLLGRLEAPAARLCYLRATAAFGWSRNVLIHQIQARYFERAVLEKKAHNFALAMPADLSNAIGVAEYQLQARLPAEFKGRLPTARQLANAVRGLLPGRD